MPYVPAPVAENPLSRRLAEFLPLHHRGKVRDTYRLPRSMMLVVATDRISVFDFVLGSLIPGKGRVLTQMTVMWLNDVLKDVPHHMIAAGEAIDNFLPTALRNDMQLQARAMVVMELEMVPVECIVRGYLTGTGWSAYQKTGEVCGHVLPAELHDGSRLPKPLFTPTTKAKEGHDEHLNAAEVLEQYGDELGRTSLEIYLQGYQHGTGCGILIADTKFEFGRVKGLGPLRLADEVLTPDSSRFWLLTDWEKSAANRKSPTGFDKQPVRDECKLIETPLEKNGKPIVGLNNLDPKDPAHQEFAGNVQLSQETIAATSQRYKEAMSMMRKE